MGHMVASLDVTVNVCQAVPNHHFFDQIRDQNLLMFESLSKVLVLNLVLDNIFDFLSIEIGLLHVVVNCVRLSLHLKNGVVPNCAEFCKHRKKELKFEGTIFFSGSRKFISPSGT